MKQFFWCMKICPKIEAAKFYLKFTQLSPVSFKIVTLFAVRRAVHEHKRFSQTKQVYMRKHRGRPVQITREL